jgi:predicted NBD/HSP70 family sugar kinase
MRANTPIAERARAGAARSTARVLAVEIGGTTVRVGCFATGASGPDTLRVATPNYLTHRGASAAQILAALGAVIERAGRRVCAGEPDVVVVAWPGPVVDGVALRSPTILGPEFDRRHDVRAQLQTHFPGARIHVLNDLTCAGYHFVASGFLDFCIVTVGSGIGNKVFLNGEPQVGAHGCGGEIGHLQMRGAPGSEFAAHAAELGHLASGRGTLWLAQARGAKQSADKSLSAHDAIPAQASAQFAARFRAGNADARSVVHAGAHPLALALGALHLGLGLMQFIIVGGFAKALGEDYRALLAGLCRELTWDVGQDWNRMIMLGDSDCDEGLSGALHYGANCFVAEPLEC